jgi:hypothetical protein
MSRLVFSVFLVRIGTARVSQIGFPRGFPHKILFARLLISSCAAV